MLAQNMRSEVECDTPCVQALSDAAIAAFGAVVEELHKIRNLHSETSGCLTEFSEVISASDTTADVLLDLQRKVEAMTEEISRFGHALACQRSDGPLRDAHNTVKRINGHGRSLSAISTLSRTTAASVGVAKMGLYLGELTETAKSIRQDASVVEGALSVLQSGFDQMRTLCNSVETGFKSLPDKLSLGRKRIVDLEHQERTAASQLSARATRLVSDSKKNLKNFVTAVQFSDRLAQRLDHIGQMLDMDDPHTSHLAAENLRDCAKIMAEISVDLRRILDDAAHLGRVGAELLSQGHIADLVSQAFTERETLIDMVTAEISDVDALLASVKADADAIAAAGEDAAASCEDLEESARRLFASSLNSLLLAARAGDRGAPLGVLATEVRSTANRCHSDVDLARELISQLAEFGADGRNRLQEASVELSQSTSAHAELGVQGAHRLSEIDRLRNDTLGLSQTLLMLIDGVHERMHVLDETGSQLVELSNSVHADLIIPPTPTDLGNVWDLYTMEEERDIHRRLYPDFAPEEAETTPSSSDDLDDLFF
ncbi:MAG: hypothetical protein N4A61_06005 [Pelagimonas sp.]|jgi:hypothetical protein|nr:hypothetical protein [Pelagimonas sp.]